MATTQIPQAAHLGEDRIELALGRVFAQAAAAFSSRKRQQRHEVGISVGRALNVYERWLREVGHKGEGNKPRTVETTTQRLRRLFAEATNVAVRALTPAFASTIRNLDDDGWLLWITDAKTQAGVRRLEVPPQLQAHLQRIARGKEQTDRLFGPGAIVFTLCLDQTSIWVASTL